MKTKMVVSGASVAVTSLLICYWFLYITPLTAVSIDMQQGLDDCQKKSAEVLMDPSITYKEKALHEAQLKHCPKEQS